MNAKENRSIGLNMIRRRLCGAAQLFQYDLLNPQRLAGYSRDLKVQIFNPETLTRLWQLGLIRADYIEAESPIIRPVLDLVRVDEDGTHIYFDKRKMRTRKSGYGSTLFKRPRLRSDIRLHFHPFRYFVLHHIKRCFATNITSTQYLSNADIWEKMTGDERQYLDAWTSNKDFCDLFDKWNRYAELAIICEPATYAEVFGSFKSRLPELPDEARKNLINWRESLKGFFQTIDHDFVEEMRGNLCREAEIVDNNNIIHVLLRLIRPEERLRLKGALGGSMLFLTMAEMARRCAERFWSVQLPEEDEVGFTQWMPGARERIFGTERVTDVSGNETREFMKFLRVDYGIGVRCYVEGLTEEGAMSEAAGQVARLQTINLSGKFIERQGKGLNFAQSLQKDIESKTYSVVLLDGDNENIVRVIKKAANDGKFFGRFLISFPDFEFANFELRELCETIVLMAKDSRIAPPAMDELLSATAGATTAKEFFAAIGHHFDDLAHIRKGERWGKFLMKHALAIPTWKRNGEESEERPIIGVVRFAIFASQSQYQDVRNKYRVDPNTGEQVRKA